MEKRLLHVREVAMYLGIKPATVYAWARRRKLPSLKIGGRLLFDRQDLDELIEGSKRPIKDDVAFPSVRTGSI